MQLDSGHPHQRTKKCWTVPSLVKRDCSSKITSIISLCAFWEKRNGARPRIRLVNEEERGSSKGSCGVTVGPLKESKLAILKVELMP